MEPEFAYLRWVQGRCAIAAWRNGSIGQVAMTPGEHVPRGRHLDVRLTCVGRCLFVAGLPDLPLLVSRGSEWDQLQPPSTLESRPRSWKVHAEGSVTLVAGRRRWAFELASEIAHRSGPEAEWTIWRLPDGLVVNDVMDSQGVLTVAGSMIEGSGPDARSRPLVGVLTNHGLHPTPPRLLPRAYSRLEDASVDSFRRISSSRWGTVVSGASAHLDAPQEFVLFAGSVWRMKRFRAFVRKELELSKSLMFFTTEGNVWRTADFGHTWESIRFRRRLARAAGVDRGLVLMDVAYSAGLIAIAFSSYDWRRGRSKLLHSGLALTTPALSEIDIVERTSGSELEIVSVAAV